MVEQLAANVTVAAVRFAMMIPSDLSGQEMSSRFAGVVPRVEMVSDLATDVVIKPSREIAHYPAESWWATGAILGAGVAWGFWRVTTSDSERSCTDRLICPWMGHVLAGGAVGGLLGWSLWYSQGSRRLELFFRRGLQPSNGR